MLVPDESVVPTLARITHCQAKKLERVGNCQRALLSALYMIVCCRTPAMTGLWLRMKKWISEAIIFRSGEPTRESWAAEEHIVETPVSWVCWICQRVFREIFWSQTKWWLPGILSYKSVSLILSEEEPWLVYEENILLKIISPYFTKYLRHKLETARRLNESVSMWGIPFKIVWFLSSNPRPDCSINIVLQLSSKIPIRDVCPYDTIKTISIIVTRSEKWSRAFINMRYWSDERRGPHTDQTLFIVC